MSILNFISNWIKEIVLVFIFASIIEMIVPNNSIKRYINMFIGILIILAILNPIIKLVNKDLWTNITTDNIQGGEFKYVDKEIDIDGDLIKIYLSKIEGDIKTTIEENSNYSVHSIKTNIHISEDVEENLKEISLELVEGLEEDKPAKRISIDKVERIEIGQKKVEKNTIDREEKNDDSIDRLRQVLSEKYQVGQSSIDILIIN